MQKSVFIALFTPVVAGLVLAQAPLQPPASPQPPAPPEMDVFFYQAAGPIEVGPLGRKSVVNAPYQASTNTETIQHLADGNVIQRSHTTKVARDGQGRTRTEQTIEKIGPWSSDDGAKTIVFISDPVGGYSYVLHPESKTAERLPFRGGFGVGGKHRAEFVFSKELPAPPPEMGGIAVGTAVAGTPVAGPETATIHVEKIGPHDLGDVKTEDLGTQQIGGVPATGRRVTHTIAANTIGNQLPIVTVTETWFSSELQTVVKSKREDPRFGETNFALENLQKGEPPADLFKVPADYTVSDGPKRPLPLKP